jgi:hypothetical protein
MGGDDPSEIEKYNPNHDSKDGRFTNATSNAASAADVAAFFAGGSSTPGGKTYNGLSLGDNEFNLSENEIINQMNMVHSILQRTKVTNMKMVSFRTLDADTIAQCHMEWDVSNPKGDYYGVLFLDPSKDAIVAKSWNADQVDMKMGKLPWMAASYAKRTDVAKALVMHEVGHEVMGEHIINNVPTNEWLDPNNPMKGDKKWKDTIHTAAQSGWQPPSEYSKQDYGEMFSECFVKKELTGTTGDKGVDSYVQDVTQNG